MQLLSCVVSGLLGYLFISPLHVVSGSPTASLPGAAESALPAESLRTVAGQQLVSLQTIAEQFLRQHMPSEDRTALPDKFIVQTVNLSIQARQASVWAAKVPLDVWLNNVVPYAWCVMHGEQQFAKASCLLIWYSASAATTNCWSLAILQAGKTVSKLRNSKS